MTLKSLFGSLKEEWLFYLSVFLALSSSLFLWRIPHITFSEIKVVFILWGFLVLIEGLKKYGIVSFVAERISNGSYLGLKLVLLSGFLSLFITNDVALLTVIPITLSLRLKNLEKVIILETIAANGISALSPVGNPQNVFIYFKYSLNLPTFFKAIFPFFLLVFSLLLLLSPKDSKSFLILKEEEVNREGILFSFLFFVFILVAVKVLPLWVGLFPLCCAALKGRELFKVDYFLLGTFIFFFAFTDNLSSVFHFRQLDPLKAFVLSSFLSQVISNVPSAILISEFTKNWKALLWGVSVGGFGTLVASLANLITYKLYKGDRGFLLRFSLYNLLFFLSTFILGLYFFIRTSP
ncbi:SLC13 family permease [Thermovibrio sp.]